MKTATLSRETFPFRSAAMEAMVETTRRALAWNRRRRQARRAVWHLANLDDHLLADLGIPRHQVRRVAREGRLPDWE
jgi:uncharacterized protein YjiS (DUF1127 family)